MFNVYKKIHHVEKFVQCAFKRISSYLKKKFCLYFNIIDHTLKKMFSVYKNVHRVEYFCSTCIQKKFSIYKKMFSVYFNNVHLILRKCSMCILNSLSKKISQYKKSIQISKFVQFLKNIVHV